MFVFTFGAHLIFTAMKHLKKTKGEQSLDEHSLLFRRLYDENKALHKLIKQLEDRDPSKPKPADTHNPEG